MSVQDLMCGKHESEIEHLKEEIAELNKSLNRVRENQSISSHPMVVSLVGLFFIGLCTYIYNMDESVHTIEKNVAKIESEMLTKDVFIEEIKEIKLSRK